MKPRLGRHIWQPSAREWEILKPLARRMRREPTESEAILWHQLRRRRVRGAKFRRQFAIDRYIVDFCSPEQRLVIEIDGPIHIRTREWDAERQAGIEGLGFRVLRFTNDEVACDLRSVAAAIERVIDEQPSNAAGTRALSPNGGGRGEG